MKIIYDTIGRSYDSTRQADPYIIARLFHLLSPMSGSLYLDVGCGTGNYTAALENMGLDFVGVEPSEEMLKAARNRSKVITWLQGSAEEIPVDGCSFDGVIATLTIHHWKNLEQAFMEISRVTKPGGRLVLFTATPEQMHGYWLNHYFAGMLRTSANQMPSLHTISKALTEAGFGITATEKYVIGEAIRDNFLYAGKHRPEIYFNDEVRMGMSSFATLANQDEVNEGLSKLKSDLETGKFKEVQEAFDNNYGDYLFIVAEKISRSNYQ